MKSFYEALGANVAFTSKESFQHVFPTDVPENRWPKRDCSVNYVSAFDFPDNQLINCGYDAAGETLKFILPNIEGSDITVAPKDEDWESKGILRTFNQREFVDLWNWSYSGLADFGYVFFPKQCIKDEAKCKVHVYLHGATT